MGLTPPTPGLRALFHNSIQPAKVQLAVPAGDTLIVSDEVAAQLQSASTHFEDVAAPTDDPTKIVAETYDAGPVPVPTAELDPEPESEPAKPKTRKRV
jgi:hypothetical protein